MFYLKLKRISGKRMEFTLINVDSLRCVPKDDMSIIWDWHGWKPHRSKRILAPISYLNLISGQPRSRAQECSLMRRWLSEDQIAELLTKTERKMHEYTKNYFLIDNSCFLRSIFLVINFWKDVNAAGTRSNTSCPFPRLCVTFHDFL